MYLRPLLNNLRRLPVAPCSRISSNCLIVSSPSVFNTSSTSTTLGSIRFASQQPASTPIGAAASNQEIYYGALTPKIRAVKVFSLTTSGVGLFVQPMLIEQGSKFGGMPMIVFLCGFAGLFTFVTPALLHFITKKYVTRIHYDATKEEYTAETISFFMLRKKHTFKASDVHVPDVTGMFTTFKVNDKALFVDVSQFTDPNHYAKMMGYDKPIDFKFDLAQHHDKVPVMQQRK